SASVYEMRIEPRSRSTSACGYGRTIPSNRRAWSESVLRPASFITFPMLIFSPPWGGLTVGQRCGCQSLYRMTYWCVKLESLSRVGKWQTCYALHRLFTRLL